MDKKNKVSKIQSYYEILNEDKVMTKETPVGFVNIFLLIEGDVKDLRMICLN